MSRNPEENELTEQEREIASQHWQAMMFAASRSELEAAQIALMQAPDAVQHAVIACINDYWLRGHDPSRRENPFLPTRS